MFIDFRLTGCLVSLILMFFIFLTLKFLHIFFLPIILLFGGSKLWDYFKNRPKTFKAKKGSTYKQCEFCGMKADRTAIRCPRCKKTFEH